MGGTKMEGVILKSADDPEVLFRDRVPTEAAKGYDHIMQQVKKLVDAMAHAAGYKPERLGIGTPGVYVPKKKVMKNCNATALNGRPFKDDLEAVLGMQLEIANDANCFALAETRLGVVKQQYPEAKVVFGIILGTGVGGGVVVNGQVLNGAHGIGGEWGHNYLPGFTGNRCFCGKEGCNESVLAGPSLERFYLERSGQQRALKEIVERAVDGRDAVAEETMYRLTEGFGLALSVVVNILDPDVVVIGGGVSHVERLYTEGVAAVQRHVLDQIFEVPVVKPVLGDSAGVYGAAFLVAEHSGHEQVSVF